MALILRNTAAITANGGTTADGWVVPPGDGGTLNIYYGTECALEYDLWIEAAPAAGDLSSMALMQWSYVFAGPTSGMFYDTVGDQEGIAANSVAGVNALVERAKGRWYHRIIKLDQPVFGGLNYIIGTFKCGLRAQLVNTLYDVPCVFKVTNVRITNHRETIRWLWRDGMANPAGGAGYTATGLYYPTVGYPDSIGGAPSAPPWYLSATDAANQLPNYCSKASVKPLDDISHQRRTGGRLNSWMFWDGVKDGFVLSNILLLPAEWDDLMTFYEIYRREAIGYRHASNKPALWVRFERPPSYEEVIYNGMLMHNTTISLLRR